MKFLSFPNVTQFNSVLNGMDSGNSKVYGGMEAFSFKSTENKTKVKKSKQIPIKQKKNSFQTNVVTPVLSPPSPFTFNTVIFQNEELREKPHIFQNLRSALNSSFPYFDFRRTRPEDFRKEDSIKDVLQNINSSLSSAFSTNDRIALVNMMDKIGSIYNSSVYCYESDGDDPLSSQGKLWNWNYFFYNESLKRIIFFHCFAKSKQTIKTDFENQDVQMDTEETFSDFSEEEDKKYFSSGKNVSYYYDMNKITSQQSMGSFMELDEEYMNEELDNLNDDDFDFDMSFS